MRNGRQVKGRGKQRPYRFVYPDDGHLALTHHPDHVSLVGESMNGPRHDEGPHDSELTISGGEPVPAPMGLTLAALFGSVPALPGRETVDFDILIREAMEEEADRIVRALGER